MKKGPAEWVEAVYERYADALTQYAFSLCREEEAARDAVQETFLRLMRVREEEVKDHLRAWLFRVCRTRLTDRWRKEGRMKSMGPDDLPEEAKDDDSPARKVEREDSLAQVLSHVERLPLSQREVVRLKFQSGLNYREIAEVSGRTVNAVGVLLHNALSRLRESIEAEEPGVARETDPV